MYKLCAMAGSRRSARVPFGRYEMTKFDEIKVAIEALPDAEKSELKRWLDVVDAQLFDEKIEADAAAGRLDGMIAKAHANYKAGRQTPL
jgi:hypothetical protein